MQIHGIDPRYVSASGINPLMTKVSPSRLVMFYGHFGQRLCISGSNTSRLESGAEREYAKYTFKVETPCDMRVVKVIERYPLTIGIGAIKENPDTIVIYEDYETGQFGVLSLPKFRSEHQHFGFQYKYKPNWKSDILAPGSYVKKGTIIADSPDVDDLGNYNYGISVPTALMSVPAIIEDGIEVSDALLPMLKTKAYETHVVSFGKRGFPLNLYGDDNNYKICPDIGEVVGKDGLLFAWREHDPLLGPVQLTRRATSRDGFDPIYDKRHYVKPGAKVIDIKVYHEKRGNGNNTQIPLGTTGQLEKYRNAQQRYCDTLIAEYEAMRKRYQHKLKITPAFEEMLVAAQAYGGQNGSTRLKRTYRAEPLDEWRVEVKIEYELIPTIGFKMTGRYGDKGVICNIRKHEDMPVDAAGNRALAIMDANSTIKRMNPGRTYEQYINAASRDLSVEIRRMYEADSSDANVELMWQRLVRYYEICSPRMHRLILSPKYTRTHRQHVEDIVKDGIYLRKMTDDDVSIIQIIDQIRKEFPPVHGKIGYRGNSGKWRISKRDILIGDLYLLLLEKTGGDWSGVASAKRSHYGMAAKITNSDKHSEVGRAQPIRMPGEAESRLMEAASDGLEGNPATEIIEMSSNPQTHRAACEAIMAAEEPTQIEKLIDRNVHPLGRHRAQELVGNQASSAGWRFVKGTYSDV